MDDVVSPAIGMTPNHSALAAMPPDMPQPFANETVTPSRSKRTRPDDGTPSGGAMVQLTRQNASSVLHGFANATAYAELLARSKSFKAVLLAHRVLENRFEAFHAEVASATAVHDLHLAALASAHDLRIIALAARPSGLTTFVAPLAPLDTRATSLEAAPADLPLDDDSEAAHVFVDRPLPADAIVCYVRNVVIAGKVTSEDFQYLEPASRGALNKRETPR